MVKLVSPGAAVLRIFRLPMEPPCLRPPEGGLHADLFLWLWTSFSTTFFAFKAFALNLSFEGAGTSFFALGTSL